MATVAPTALGLTGSETDPVLCSLPEVEHPHASIMQKQAAYALIHIACRQADRHTFVYIHNQHCKNPDMDPKGQKYTGKSMY